MIGAYPIGVSCLQAGRIQDVCKWSWLTCGTIPVARTSGAAQVDLLDHPANSEWYTSTFLVIPRFHLSHRAG